MKRKKAFFVMLQVLMLFIFVSFCSAQIKKNEREILQQGIDFFKSGVYEKAIDSFFDVIKISIDKDILLKAHIYLGYTYYSLENRDEATRQLEAAIGFAPDLKLSEEEFVPAFIEFVKVIKKDLVGIVFIESIPSKAFIYLNKKKLGLTPFKKELLAKKYLLRLVKAGYDPHEEEIAIISNDLNNKMFDLSKGKNWKTFARSCLIMLVLGMTLSKI